MIHNCGLVKECICHPMLQLVLSFSEEQSKSPFMYYRWRSNWNPEMFHVFFNGSPSLLPYTFSLKSSLFHKESCPTPQPRIPAAFKSLSTKTKVFLFYFINSKIKLELNKSLKPSWKINHKKQKKNNKNYKSSLILNPQSGPIIRIRFTSMFLSIICLTCLSLFLNKNHIISISMPIKLNNS